MTAEENTQKNLSRKLIWKSFPCVFRLFKWFYHWTGPSSSSCKPAHLHFLKMILKKLIKFNDVIWRKYQIPVLCLVGYGYSTLFEFQKWSAMIRYVTEIILPLSKMQWKSTKTTKIKRGLDEVSQRTKSMTN